MKKLQNGFYISEAVLDEKKKKKNNGFDIKFVPDHGTALKYLNKNLANDPTMPVSSAAAAGEGSSGGDGSGGGMGEDLSNKRPKLNEDFDEDTPYIMVKLSLHAHVGDEYYKLPNANIVAYFCADNDMSDDDVDEDDFTVIDVDTNLDFEASEVYTLSELNEMADYIEDRDITITEIENAQEAYGGDIDSVIKDIHDDMVYFHPGLYSWSDVGKYIFENWYDGSFDEIGRDISWFIDLDAIGSDLDMDTYTCYKRPNPEDLSFAFTGEGDDDYDFDDSERETDCNAGEYFCGDPDASYKDIGQAYIDEVGGIEYLSDPESYFRFGDYGESFSDLWCLTSDGAVEYTD